MGRFKTKEMREALQLKKADQRKAEYEQRAKHFATQSKPKHDPYSYPVRKRNGSLSR